MPRRRTAKVQRTIRMPAPVFEEAERLIRNCGQCESINEFVVRSMMLRINVLKRKELDAQFAAMATDEHYQKEAQLMAEEFADSDWETASQIEG